MLKYKNSDSFILNKEKNKYLTPSINPTSFVRKIKNQSSWVKKYLELDASIAIEETVAQEFFRLICPFYPKTRWGEKDGVYFVLSKEILGFKPNFFLSPEGKETIINKKPKGLAAAQVISLLLSEVDFKEANVGIDQEGRVIKIDGGLCFAVKKEGYEDLFIKEDLNITQEDIEALPALRSYQPVNWLDLFIYHEKKVLNQRGKEETVGKVLFNSDSNLMKLSSDSLAFYREELNQTILRICLLPKELIEYFTQSYVPNKKMADNLANIIFVRKNQLEAESNKIKSFQDYKSSNEAKKDILDFVKNLEQFKTMGKSVLFDQLKNLKNYNTKEAIYSKFIPEYETVSSFLIEINTYLSRKEKQLNHNSFKISFVNTLKGLIVDYLENPSSAQLTNLSDQLFIAKDQFLIESQLSKHSTCRLDHLINTFKVFLRKKSNIINLTVSKDLKIATAIEENQASRIDMEVFRNNVATFFKPKIRKNLITMDQMLYGSDAGLVNIALI